MQTSMHQRTGTTWHLRSRMLRFVRPAGIGELAGLVGGGVWGIGARGAMRIMAVAAGQPTGFSIEGTLFILMAGALFGIPAGLLWVGGRRVIPGTGMRKGLACGLLVLLILGYFFYTGPIQDESGLGHPVLASVLFGALFVLFGMVLEAGVAWLDRHIARPEARFATITSLAILAIPCCIEILIAAVILRGPGG